MIETTIQTSASPKQILLRYAGDGMYEHNDHNIKTVIIVNTVGIFAMRSCNLIFKIEPTTTWMNSFVTPIQEATVTFKVV